MRGLRKSDRDRFVDIAINKLLLRASSGNRSQANSNSALADPAFFGDPGAEFLVVDRALVWPLPTTERRMVR